MMQFYAPMVELRRWTKDFFMKHFTAMENVLTVHSVVMVREHFIKHNSLDEDLFRMFSDALDDTFPVGTSVRTLLDHKPDEIEEPDGVDKKHQRAWMALKLWSSEEMTTIIKEQQP